jgi:glutaredoxin-like protein NrdH
MPVTIYTQPNCAHCDASKAYMDREDIGYVEKNIRADPSALDEVLALGYRGTPVIVTEDGEHWGGANIEKMAALKK